MGSGWYLLCIWQDIFLSSFIFPNKNITEFSQAHTFYNCMPLRQEHTLNKCYLFKTKLKAIFISHAQKNEKPPAPVFHCAHYFWITDKQYRYSFVNCSFLSMFLKNLSTQIVIYTIHATESLVQLKQSLKV